MQISKEQAQLEYLKESREVKEDNSPTMSGTPSLSPASLLEPSLDTVRVLRAENASLTSTLANLLIESTQTQQTLADEADRLCGENAALRLLLVQDGDVSRTLAEEMAALVQIESAEVATQTQVEEPKRPPIDAISCVNGRKIDSYALQSVVVADEVRALQSMEVAHMESVAPTAVKPTAIIPRRTQAPPLHSILANPIALAEKGIVAPSLTYNRRRHARINSSVEKVPTTDSLADASPPSSETTASTPPLSQTAWSFAKTLFS
ncbi:hypothetical protein BC830DRAFT_498589 [Chytriomyces sp. MP71]|nr:hypothetical protein BC830DRAFT_498589 [Chytriomyces sp. MP71]